MSEEAVSSNGHAQGPVPAIENVGIADTSHLDGDINEAIRIANGRKAERQEVKGPVPETPAELAAIEAPKKEEKPAVKAAEAPPSDKKEADAPKASDWAKLHAENKRLTAEKLEIKNARAELENFQKVARTDKIAALKLLGYNDPIKFLEDVAATDGKADPKVSQMEMELRALKEEREQEKAAARARQEEAEQRQAVDRVNQEIVSFIKNDSKFGKGLVSHPEGQVAIFNVMREHYQQGKSISVAQAAEIVEKTWEGGLLSFVNNPRGRELLLKALNESDSKPGAASEQKQPPKVLAVREQSPEKTEEVDKSGEKELAEASRWLKQRMLARRNA